MPPVVTRGDIYPFVVALIARQNALPPPLARYLCALRAVLLRVRHEVWLAPDTFTRALSEAFHTPGPWPEGPAPEGAPGFAEVEALLRRQLQQLSALERRGATRDAQRYFGVDTPDGSRWYNVDTLSYLECAAQGAFGGEAPLEEDEEESGALEWEDVERFLRCGQSYE